MTNSAPTSSVQQMIWSLADLRALETIRLGPSEVVYAFVSLVGEPATMDEGLLDDEERRRARRFVKATHRHRFVLAHAALRLFLARCLVLEPMTVRYESDPLGKPRLVSGLAPLEFNLSHSESVGLLAVTRDRSVGVDIEHARAVPDALEIADRHFSPVERTELRALPPAERQAAFFRCWTRKEAVIKTSGEGLSRALDSFDVDLTADSTSALKRIDGRSGQEADLCLRDLPSPPGYAAAGAVAAPARVRLQWRKLSLEARK